MYDEVLQIPVAIKEYFPQELIRRDTEDSDAVAVEKEKNSLYVIGMEHFIREARVLGMMKNMRGVVAVQDYFEENETAYVLDMRGMFWNCSSLRKLDLSSFNTSGIIYMDNMFGGSSSLPDEEKLPEN